MISSYAIFPTEALLLGECLGEYLEGDGRFMEYVERRLGPMLPSLIEYKQLYGLGLIADSSRKSLMDRILFELTGLVSTSRIEKTFALHPLFPLIKQYSEANASLQELTNERSDAEVDFAAAIRPIGKDNRDAIESLIRKVVKNNGYEALFQVGMSFGKSVSQCEAASRSILDIELDVPEEDEEFQLDEFVSLDELTSLANHEVVRTSGVSYELLLKRSKEISLPFDLDELAGDAQPIIDQVNGLLGALWLGFGEVLGAAREQDLYAHQQNQVSATPRALRVGRSASRDEVNHALQEAEKLLAEEKTGENPERIVRNLEGSIEALSRRIWKNEFRDATLGMVLANKLRSSNVGTIQKRFASVARTLHLSYRNPISHSMDAFRCTFAEAAFFVSGVRCLLVLSDIILDKRPKDRTGGAGTAC